MTAEVAQPARAECDGIPAFGTGRDSYRFTFGFYAQTTAWLDIRSLPWDRLADLLTCHEIGRKEGTCIVPAVFRGERRLQTDTEQIDVAFLDSDAGYTLDEISVAVSSRSWAAIISSTHSHLTTRTRVRRSHWQLFKEREGEAANAATFLVTVKGYLPRVARDARVLNVNTNYVSFEHQPCPKFRVVIPLLRPWRAADYPKQNDANDAWKERVGALAAALDLAHDQACTDTSRLFYLPRRPRDGPSPETLVLKGHACDIFGLSAAAPDSVGVSPDKLELHEEDTSYTDPDSGEVIDLRAWAREHAHCFQIVDALKARSPRTFTGKLVNRKHHILCANEAEHTEAGADAATIVINASDSANRGFVYHCRHAHCTRRDRLFFLARMLREKWLSLADLTDPLFQHGRQANERLIRVTPGELPALIDAAEAALLGSGLEAFQRGPSLVRPGTVRVAAGESQRSGRHQIVEIEDLALVETMTVAARWERYDNRARAWVRTDAPLKVARAYKQRVGHWRLPVLAGIITAPTLRADGSVLDRPGYDAATGLYFAAKRSGKIVLPGFPTRAHALAALQQLRGLLATFPFVDEPSRAVALSGILTACVRHALPTAPLHGFSAPVPGSGKSMLVDIVSCVSTGREASVISQGRSSEELEKRLGALLLIGEPVIAIDNCEVPLKSDFLCAMLTQATVRARVLGKSEAPALPTNAVVTATGNNLVLAGDLTRRSIVCHLDPQQERPELRQFDLNPLALVRSDRARFLGAALTILRASRLCAHSPPAPLGSFEGWSDWIRGALLWLGEKDPIATMEIAREQDPDRESVLAVHAHWEDVIGDRPVTVRELIDIAARQLGQSPAHAASSTSNPFQHADFREALLAVAGDAGVVNGKRLGNWLGSRKDRITDGRKIVKAGLISGTQRWRLIRCP